MSRRQTLDLGLGENHRGKEQKKEELSHAEVVSAFARPCKFICGVAVGANAGRFMSDLVVLTEHLRAQRDLPPADATVAAEDVTTKTSAMTMDAETATTTTAAVTNGVVDPGDAAATAAVTAAAEELRSVNATRRKKKRSKTRLRQTAMYLVRFTWVFVG